MKIIHTRGLEEPPFKEVFIFKGNSFEDCMTALTRKLAEVCTEALVGSAENKANEIEVEGIDQETKNFVLLATGFRTGIMLGMQLLMEGNIVIDETD